MIEFKALLSSKDFKDIMKIDFVKDNLYLWRVTFDITKYELSKELRTDFQQREL